jgi:glycosyltransferase involved in cell wall biosynthesis
MNAASAMVLAAVRDRLGQLQHGAGELRIDNTSHRRWRGGRYKAWKMVRTGWALLKLLLTRRRDVVLYLAANSRSGLWLDVAAAGIARLRGFPVVLHHHVYAYLMQRDRRMARVCRWMGERGTHVVLDAGMAGRLRWVYGTELLGSEVLCVPNRIPDDEGPGGSATAAGPGDAGRPLRLGHLSNLTREKGLDLVIDTTCALRQRGEAVELVLAGPCVTKDAKALVTAAQKRLGAAVDYRGPVYDQAKRDFWRSIDVFLFPTRYNNEAQPLVILEALAWGVPVVAYARGGIGALLAPGSAEDHNAPGQPAAAASAAATGTADERPAGIALDVQADFVRRAVRVIQGWARDPARLAASAQAARRRADQWRGAAEAATTILVDLLVDGE